MNQCQMDTTYHVYQYTWTAFHTNNIVFVIIDLKGFSNNNSSIADRSHMEEPTKFKTQDLTKIGIIANDQP